MAIVPPEQVREDLDEFCAPRRTALPDLRWTDAFQWHLTLAFLPDVLDADLDELTDRLADAAARRRPPDARLAGGGVFPDATRAKVLWTGVEATADDRAELDRLSVGCRNAAVAAGTTVEGRGFTPHVTLARLACPADASGLLEVFGTYVGPSWRAAGIELVASYLGEGPGRRPRYETLAELPLGRR
ncbi:RNA 2',3'-cyclic phosphodiesterase [Mobilicoccus pelagius]|uniref:RNA 2',3'-cyclic phosphodiesterase n=1 Tax=Mobilicoccus pelagius TaxID=746032 RepID=UPI001FE05A13|nr:RNA 2',3'-cyclic phosphodiesterase [Mobilicoccus pelagius]